MNEHTSNKPLFFAYLKMHRKIICFFGIALFIFCLLFYLYKLPLAATGYGLMLCLLPGSLFLTADFLAFRKRHRQLIWLQQKITVDLESLPKPCTLLEEDYQELLYLLQQDRLSLLEEKSQSAADLTDYYTTWVHQIKTPIAAMRLLLQEEELAPALSEELQRIEQYVEMVLTYLRLGSDSTDYVFKEYDLDAIIRQALRKYASQFIRRKLTLNYTPVCCLVLTDEKWLLFVLEQVLSNALKYTKSGSITISMPEPDTLSIRDTGIGIASQDLPRIFEKGYTGYNGREDRRSSGIGLYLCRRICRNLGHTIQTDSRPGKGTEIKICLKRGELEMEPYS